ncbi:unnamed protein product, partial [Polarella glacialis]
NRGKVWNNNQFVTDHPALVAEENPLWKKILGVPSLMREFRKKTMRENARHAADYAAKRAMVQCVSTCAFAHAANKQGLRVQPEEYKALTCLGKAPPISKQSMKSDLRSAGVLKLSRLVFELVHPLTTTRTVTFRSTNFISTLIVMTSPLGTLSMNALFLSAVGESLNLRSDAECAQSSPTEVYARQVFVGLFSLLLGSLPQIVFLALQTRQFVDRKRYRRLTSIQWQLRRWDLEDMVVIFMAAVYCAACYLYLILFLANISDVAERKWIIGVSTGVISDY